MEITLTDLATLLLAGVTAISLFYISRQVSITGKQAKGEFLLALDEQFESTNAIARRILSQPNFTPNGDEWIEVWRMMSVFERINIMVDDGILDVDVVDRLHGFRLLVIIGNDAIYQRLQQTGGEWQDFVQICYLIADRRERLPDITDTDRAFITRVRALNKHARKVPNPFAF